MLQLISPSMVESCISVSVSNPVRAYLAAIFKMMWKNVAQSYLADRVIIIEPARRKNSYILTGTSFSFQLQYNCNKF